MKAAVIPNLKKSAAKVCVEETLRILREAGCETLLREDLFDAEGIYHEPENRPFESCDLFIAIGGDGTIIHTAKLAASYDKPVLGVNAGNMGFTAGLEPGELHLLPRLLKGGYRLEQRLMVEVQVTSKGERLTYLALNDAVVTGEPARIVDYRMALGENQGYPCRADGFIVATPTGSTAYSLSAGGPVIQPDMDCLVYTPICSHALFNRSVIFGGETRLTVDVPENRGKIFLAVDGDAPLLLSTGDRLVFRRAERSARFIRLGENDFYDVLNQKIIETR